MAPAAKIGAAGNLPANYLGSLNSGFTRRG